nr:hypothetical protein [uncultured Porphyromonas sp.]
MLGTDYSGGAGQAPASCLGGISEVPIPIPTGLPGKETLGLELRSNKEQRPFYSDTPTAYK